MKIDELKQLAMDIVDDKVFLSSYLKKPEDGMMVFMVLMLMGPAEKEKLKDAALFYEYYDKAGPSGYNGYPIFYSIHWVSNEDYPTLKDLIDKYYDIKKSLLNPPKFSFSDLITKLFDTNF